MSTAPKAESLSDSAARTAYDLLTAEDDGRVCRDIPEQLCDEQPRNFSTHVVSLALTKTADALLNPKLILSWILTTLGASQFVGLLVPIREAGALLPQLFIADRIRNMPLRKYAWAVGSALQGLCAGGIAMAAMLLEGDALGWTIISLLTLLALSRSICSVSYKDVLGKTVGKSRRGTATGSAATVAAAMTIAYAVLIASGLFDKINIVIIGLIFATFFWLTAGFLFSTLKETAGATEGGANPVSMARENLRYLIDDRELRLFIITRSLLLSTALAPPFMLALKAESMQESLHGLGWLLLASSLASLLSSYVWGRLSDRSSRKVLLLAGLGGGVSLTLTVIASQQNWLSLPWLLPFLLFSLMIAYGGVRLGRSVHLVDIADQDKRAIYTALSNTIIGIILLLTSLFSIIASLYGEAFVLAMFALMSFASMTSAYLMREAQA
ncbi:MFS transporter [Methylophaga sp. OBS1]|uniref:MFS transporter n=1 Tax=Methylophaga sp. OBS1 TaxID=2991933 RepID=UPI0022561F42|nr:MFS transporter [Methylophaga sp. OBS1]MCX4193659.1 MFS transporter [Methylophaga sp. OBS1]